MSAPAPERLRLWLRLLKAQGLIEAEIRRRLRDDFDTTLPRFDVMAALSRYPDGLKMSEISGLLRVSNGNVTGIVDRLVKDGQALRVSVPGDRRAQRVRLTVQGRADFERQADAHRGWIEALLGGLDPAEVEMMARMLKRVSDALEQHEEAGHAP